ncbi:MAG: tetratricopeptide repeat protein [Bacteroidetes bacterium]|nr:tetratricopeptide repeat protein [Bacteroidota bacterium]MDA0904440.1 tetratricopeptide repeat protein [Bacteroidota bacterium]MDA1242074.1 tetratricopeptide repeat protein [Bacteroidota bacterium]
MTHRRLHLTGTSPYPWVVVMAAWIMLPGCTLVSNLVGKDGDMPYAEEVQRTWFEGQGHLLKGDLEDAYASFLTCAEAQPEEYAFHYNLGKIDVQLKRYEAAIAHLDRALELEPSNTWVAFHHGEALLGAGDGEGAAKDWMAFTTARPGDIEAVGSCTAKLVAEGHVSPALALLEHYERHVGLDPDVRMEALRIVEHVASPKDLGMFLTKAVEDFPKDEVFALQLARWFMAAGNLDAALDLLSELAGRSDWGLIQFELAEVYTRRDQLSQALIHLQRAFASTDVPLEDKLQVALAYHLLAQGSPEFSEAANVIQVLLETHHRDDHRVLAWARDRAQEEGRLVDALSLGREVVAMTPGSLDAWVSLAALEAEARQWEAMLEVCDEALARFPLSPLLHYDKGHALGQMDRHSEAVEAYRGGLGVVVDEPAMTGALAAGLAQSLRELGKLDDSEQAFERSLRAYEDPYVLNNHAYYLAGRHNLPSGKASLDRALECSTKANALMSGEGNFMDTQAYILYKLQRLDEALVWILDAQSNGMNGDPVALEHEGDIRRAMGDEAGALDAFQRAIDAGGKLDVLNAKLRRE